MRYNNLVIGQPLYLYILIPLALLLIYILRKKFIDDEKRLYKKSGKKRFFFISRLLFFSVLLISLSNPYLELRQDYGEISKIHVLIDDSLSMQLYNVADVERNLDKITGISTDIDRLNLADYSALGNAILNYLGPDENILLVTDGQNNFGSSLEDVALFASSINTRLFGIELEQKEDDAIITIKGPDKVVSGVENEYEIKVEQIGSTGRKQVKIFIDNKAIYDEKYTEDIIIKRSFVTGSHAIKAVLEVEDRFPENNVYYKTVSVFDKPRILMINKQKSPITDLYAQFYDIETKQNSDLDDYHAVILNNMHADLLSDDFIDELEEFVIEGNGLFVIGGKDSYDWGDYNESLLLNLLPVNIGRARKKKDVTNIFILMDTGAGAYNYSKEKTGETQFIDIQKSIAVDMVKSITPSNLVGIIEANMLLNTISELSELGPKRAQLIDTISRLTTHGISEFQYAYKKAHDILRLSKGGKNIVMITDGDILPYEKPLVKKLVERAFSDGIKTFIISTGKKSDNAFLKSIKELGGGEYFTVDETQKIKIYFGDPREILEDDLELFIYDSNHFITKDLDNLGRIYGFNGVYPKTNARILITTSGGDPVLTVWNFGLGRVASLSTDDGSSWIPDMLRAKNSKLMIKTLNWLIEDPERKNDFKLEVPELREGENSLVTLRSKTYPESELFFYEINNNLFQANYYPTDIGIQEILGQKVAVNYKKEFLKLGMNENFQNVLAISNGELLKNDASIIEEKIKSLSRVKTLKLFDLSWIFVLGAIVIYLFELLIRRIYELKQAQ